MKVHDCDYSCASQSSHLESLLFVLFINELCELIQSAKLLYENIQNCAIVFSAIQRAVDVLQEWCQINGMNINAG